MTEILVAAAFGIAVILVNLWTMKRAEAVEQRIRKMLWEDGMLCPLCGDHYQRTECGPRQI